MDVWLLTHVGLNAAVAGSLQSVTTFPDALAPKTLCHIYGCEIDTQKKLKFFYKPFLVYLFMQFKMSFALRSGRGHKLKPPRR